MNTISGSTIIYGNTIFGAPPTAPAGIDFSFKSGFQTNDIVRDIKVQSDGKIIVGGIFSSYSGVSRNNIVRLNTDGSIDNTFNVGVGFNSFVFSIAIQSDGKIICSGVFSSYSGVSYNRIIRLNTDGSIDNTFVIGTGFNNEVFRVLLQSDGKLVCTGAFSSYSGVSRNGIVRLNSNGTIDNTFVVGTGFNSVARPFQIQSDGKIVVGGNFTTYQGVAYNRIIRLNTDGSIDNTFVVGTGFNSNPIDIILQNSNSNIICVGGFTTYSGQTNNGIIELNTNGGKDTSFNVGSGISLLNTTPLALAEDYNGKILVGALESYQNNPIKYLIRLNSDGTIDNSFSVVDGFAVPTLANTVRKITIQNDGKILVGGNFTSYYGVNYISLIRLNGN